MADGVSAGTNLVSKGAAAAVHFFTASGAVCALLALHSVHNGQIETAFLWLGIALIIDGLDGPVARRIKVEDRLPRFSGERLDLIVDYLNYVAIPAFILIQDNLVPAGTGVWAGSAILVTSLYHFADKESKTSDGFFIGFPAIWNVIIFFLYALDVPNLYALVTILLLSVMIFVPVKWVHPIRVQAWRPFTVAFMFGWAAAALITIMKGFPATGLPKLILYASIVYFVCIGLSRSFRRFTSS